MLGDRFIGLTGEGKAAMGELTPDIMEAEHSPMDAEWMHDLNKLGKIDTLEMVPNSETSFLACIKNVAYEFNLRNEQIRFETDVHLCREGRIECYFHKNSMLYPTFGQLLSSDYSGSQARQRCRKMDVGGL